MIEDLQKEYDIINAKKRALYKKIKDNNFVIENHKVVVESEAYGYFYNICYYSHFDEHLSEAIYFNYSGACEITIAEFDTIKRSIEHNDSESIKELEFDVTEHFYYTDFMKYFKIIDENNIVWQYEGNNNQAELTNDSIIKFTKTTRTKINKYN